MTCELVENPTLTDTTGGPADLPRVNAHFVATVWTPNSPSAAASRAEVSPAPALRSSARELAHAPGGTSDGRIVGGAVEGRGMRMGLTATSAHELRSAVFGRSAVPAVVVPLRRGFTATTVPATRPFAGVSCRCPECSSVAFLGGAASSALIYLRLGDIACGVTCVVGDFFEEGRGLSSGSFCVRGTGDVPAEYSLRLVRRSGGASGAAFVVFFARSRP